MAVDKEKIGILTTVANWNLYEKTIHFFPKNIQIFAIDGTKGKYGLKSMVFFMKKLKKYDLDWLILADEDVVFTNPEGVFSLIDYLDENNYTVSGMSEADRLESWTKHPYVINTFFGILNLKEIYKIYDEREMLSNQYAADKEFPNQLEELPPYEYPMTSLAEPYYCYFLWLLRKGKKTKFLKSSRPLKDDFLTNSILDHRGQELLYHTWYARFYGGQQFHTNRINQVVKKGKFNRENPQMIIFKDSGYNLKFFFYKYFRKVRRLIVE